MTRRSRMILVGLAAPLILALAALIVVLAVAPALPDPIAIHWGLTGEADGFGPLWVTAVLPLVVTLGFSLMLLPVLRSAHDRTTVIHKLLLVTGVFLGAMMAIVSAGSVLIQRGLDDASQAPSVVPVLLLAVGAGIGLAVVGWFALPPVSAPEEPDPVDRPTLSLTTTARASWIAHAEPSRVLAALITGLLLLGLAVLTYAVAAAAPLPVLLLHLGVVLVILFFGIGMLSWRVSIDQRGFRATALFGVPRLCYELSQIQSASVVQVNPVSDFGGWGLRWGGSGRMGIVLRSGEAIAVTRNNGKTLVVTVPAARTGAALLNALVDMSAQARTDSEQPIRRVE